MTSPKKTVLVTGCTLGGIGNALAREFHAKGLRVFASARSKEELGDLSSESIETLSLDVTSAQSIQAAKVEIEELTGGRGLDILVNNAGRNYTVPALEVDFDEVQATFDTNLFGVMRMCQAFAPLLIRAKGVIVQIGSVAGVIPYVFGSTYNASKAALHAYSNTLRLELAPFGVRVVTIVTGGVKSRIARTERDLPKGSLYLPLNNSYQHRLTHSQQGAMPNEAYARSVVSHVLRPSPPKWIWEGNKAWTVWLVDTFLPRGIWDYLLPRMFGLDVLTKMMGMALKER